MESIRDILPIAFEKMCQAANSANGIGGIASGFEELDKMLGGFDDADLVVVGARPSTGKTSFLLSTALNVARSGVPVLFYSFEMNAPQLVVKALSNFTEIDSSQLASGRLTEKQWSELNACAKTLDSLPLYIVDRPSREIEIFCKAVEENVKNTGAKIIFIDYLQLFTSTEKFQNRYEETAYFTRELKHIARILNLPVVIASQLNRGFESRSDSGDPRMSDLRDSGTICEVANVVLLLDRPELRKRCDYDEEGNDIRGLVNVIVAKNQMGPAAVAALKFKPACSRFEDMRYNVTYSGKIDWKGGEVGLF